MGIKKIWEKKEIEKMSIVLRWFWNLWMNKMKYMMSKGELILGRKKDYDYNR